MGALHHRLWQGRLQGFVDGELPPARAARVRAHVADCPDCAAELELLHRMKGALGRLGTRYAGEAAVERLRRRAEHLGP